MPYKFLISGGGTGGHIFPAIAIADQLKAMHPDASFLFVGAIGKMEMEKVPRAGYEIVGLNITGIQRKLSLANLVFPFKLITSLLKARSILKRFQPDVVIGVGGFASGPVLRMATWMKLPALIQEQNSFAGITNRWVAKDVDRACVAYDNMERFFPKQAIVKTGNPVRKAVVTIEGKRAAALEAFGFSSDKPVLLIVGGSLGARSINLAIKKDLDALLKAGLQVLWQTGKSFKDEAPIVQQQYEGQPLVIKEFIFDMDNAYAAADMVVSRAGAIAVSELCIVGKPTILVPFPFAAEDHQTKNAEALVKINAARMVADKEVQAQLLQEVLALKEDEQLRRTLSQNIKQHALPKAAEDIATEVIKLVGR
jgi:UDP-N-acetylglucosamine--N-acetylmuramyl-(pentapeptide) pyrophosphoryl-undecaprenol N-acetylglucosamine transferase